MPTFQHIGRGSKRKDQTTPIEQQLLEGNALCKAGHFLEAVVHYTNCLAAQPESTAALSNRAYAYKRLARYQEALKDYQQALTLTPDDAGLHWNLALLLLLLGRYREGFAEYEWRWQWPGLPSVPRDFGVPQWRPLTEPDEVVLIHAEQGFGDTIQFSRWVPQLAGRCRKLYFEVQPELLELFRQQQWPCEIIPMPTKPADITRSLPVMSIPHALALENAAAFGTQPYLKAPASSATMQTEDLTVGLVWRGRPTHGGDDRRSLPLSALRPLFDLPEIYWRTLTLLDVQAEIEANGLGGQLLNMTAPDDDFWQTAQKLQQIDVLISVDTAIAHLAGALGIHCLLLLPHQPDWRWGVQVEQSAWYQSLRLFRCPSDLAWGPVVDNIRNQLVADLARKQNKPTQAELLAVIEPFQQGRLSDAERLARALIANYPQESLGYKALGAALQGMGRLTEALPPMQKNVQLDPHDPEALSNLGNLLKDMHKPEEAESYLRQALALNPRHAPAWSNLGNVLKALGRLNEGLAAHLKAAELAPAVAEIRNNLGATLRLLGRYEEAADSFQEAIRLKPGYAVAHANLGTILRNLQQTRAAEKSFAQALALEPNNLVALEGCGLLHADSGEFDRARHYFEQVLKVEPDNPSAWAELAMMRKMTADDAPWFEKAQQLAQKQRVPQEYRRVLFYAMGKYCNDTKAYSQAFEYYRQANNSRKALDEAYDGIAFAREIDAIIAAHLASQDHQVGASRSRRPLFIIGMPRSGTSLLEQILASHPQVHGAGELPFWGKMKRQWREAMLTVGLSPSDRERIAMACLQNLDQHSSQASRVVDKMPGNYLHAGLIHEIFPEARILHTQRHPIDTCLSIYFQNFNKNHAYANDLDDLAHYYREYHRLMAHWRSVLPAEVFMDVPYEAVVEDQEGWSRRIIDFIGLEWDERCLEFYKTARRVGTASNWQARQPIYKSSKERWRNYEQFVGPLLPLLELYDPAAGKQ